MSDMTIEVYLNDSAGIEYALAWIMKPGVANALRRVNSQAQATAIAQEFGIDPKSIGFTEGAIKWCQQHWPDFDD
jgi:hypothetical protein